MEFILGTLLFTIVSSVVVIASAIWVYGDAKRHREAGVRIMSPTGWSILVLLFWFPLFIVYLIRRKIKYKRQVLS